MLDGIRMSSYRQFLVETTLEVHKLEKWAGSLAEEQFWGMLRMLSYMQQQSMGVCTGVEIGLCDHQDQMHNCANPKATAWLRTVSRGTWLLLGGGCHHPKPRWSLSSF